MLIVLPLPAKPLWPNARPHWATKARAVKEYRGRARIEAIVAIGRNQAPRWAEAEVTCRFYFPDKRLRDRDNCLAAMKSAFDGLADAGLIANDSGLIHRPVVRDVDSRQPRVEVFVFPVDPK